MTVEKESAEPYVLPMSFTYSNLTRFNTCEWGGLKSGVFFADDYVWAYSWGDIKFNYKIETPKSVGKHSSAPNDDMSQSISFLLDLPRKYALEMRNASNKLLKYIDGIVYMSPSPSTDHQRISMSLTV